MFQWLIVHTVTSAVLAVVVLTASRWFRLGAAARHLLWLVVLVKFQTPPIVYWPWTLPRLASAPAVTMPTTTAPPVSAVRMVVIDMPDFGPDPEVIDRQPLAPVTAATAKEQPAAPPFSWDWLPATAGWTWLTGGVLVALLQAIRIFRWRLRLTKGAAAPDGLETLVRELAGAMGLSPPRLIVLRSVASPMVWCFGLPRLLWPSGLEDRLSAEGCRAVLLHELAHLRRRDHWVGWLVLIGGCVWWWHPLFWWLRRRLGQEAELACDAWVVGAAPAARRAYAEAILEVSQRMSAAVAVPALGAAGNRRDLERRLVMIMRGPASRRLSWVGLAGATALGLLALPAWTLGEDKTAPQPPAPTGVTGEAAPAAVPPLPAPDRDQKLKELDDKVQQLLKEMQQLRDQVSPADKYEDLTEFHFTGGTGSATSIKDKGVFTVLTVAADKAKTKLSITFAFKEDTYRRADDFRVIAVDASGKRYEGNVQSSAGAEGNGVEMVTLVSEFPLASGKITALAIRQRTEKGRIAPTGDQPEGAVTRPETNHAAPAPPTNESRAKTAHPEISSTLGDYQGP